MRKIPLTLIVCSLATGVVLAWYCWPLVRIPGFADKEALCAKGQFGDSYGALNTLFTGLALLGVILTIGFQIREFYESENDKRKEHFEERLFKLFELLSLHLNSIEHSEKPFTGRRAIKEIFRHLCKTVESDTRDASMSGLITHYELTYHRFQDELGPYFRLLYRTLKYIDNSSIPEKQEYAHMLRATLSSSELCLLAANGLSKYGKKIKPFIERYHLLKHIPKSTRFDLEGHIMGGYLGSAFQDEQQ